MDFQVTDSFGKKRKDSTLLLLSFLFFLWTMSRLAAQTLRVSGTDSPVDGFPGY